MKKINILLAAALPLLACASDFKVDETIYSPSSPNAIIEQKAEESGISFFSNNQEYKLISGGIASKNNNSNLHGSSSSMSASLSSSVSSSSLWQGTKAGYNLFIKEKSNSPVTASVSNTSIFYQIGYNPRTKGIAIINGKIIVTYTNEFPPEKISEYFNINVVDHFPAINVAFFIVPEWADIFTITDILNQSDLVSKAEIEVLDNEYIPL